MACKDCDCVDDIVISTPSSSSSSSGSSSSGGSSSGSWVPQECPDPQFEPGSCPGECVWEFGGAGMWILVSESCDPGDCNCASPTRPGTVLHERVTTTCCGPPFCGGCFWIWDGEEWVMDHDCPEELDPLCTCPGPPTIPGSFMGEGQGVPCYYGMERRK